MPWVCELRDAYEDLRTRAAAVHSQYREFASDLVHYCDGDSTRPRFRPADLVPMSALPPLKHILDGTSNKLPAQRQLASIVHHEDWLACVAANRAADAAALAAGTAARRLRESTRIVDVGQRHAGSGLLQMLPTSRSTRISTVEWLWAMQRRFGLFVSATLPLFRLLASIGVHYDELADRLTHEALTDKSLPHNSALRVWHDAHQATAHQAVVLGDKEAPDVYAMYNDGCVVDLAEERMGKGGGDLCVELKVYSSLVDSNASAEHETSFHGDTHAFGNSEERLIRKVLGVKERRGDAAWDAKTGSGAVAAHAGDYDDAIRNKGNTVLLRLHNLFGGFTAAADKDLRALSNRPIDRTEYESPGASFVPHWARRISAAIVTADARRCLRRLPGLRALIRDNTNAAPRRRNNGVDAPANDAHDGT